MVRYNIKAINEELERDDGKENYKYSATCPELRGWGQTG